EVIEGEIRADPRFHLGQEGEIADESYRCGVDARALRRDVFWTLTLERQLVEIAIDRFNAPVDKVGFRELPGPFEQAPPLGTRVRLVLTGRECRRDKSAGERLLVGDGCRRTRLIPRLDRLGMLEVPR